MHSHCPVHGLIDLNSGQLQGGPDIDLQLLPNEDPVCPNIGFSINFALNYLRGERILADTVGNIIRIFVLYKAVSW